MKVKKAPAKQPEPEEDSESNEESMEVDSGAGESEEEIDSGAGESGDDSGSDEDDDDVPQTADPVSANQKIIDQMDEGDDSSSDDDAPVEMSSKIKQVKEKPKPKEKAEKEVPAEEKKPAYEKEDEARTVFCGNIPNAPNINETRLKDLFSQYGTVKSLRFRTEAGKVIFSKKIKKDCKSFLAYVVFEKEDEAHKSVQLNGFKLLENHLRVNMANKKNEAFSNKGTIFVGNLQFEATEAEVHEYFKQVGEIIYVRKIANKGIAYVSFEKGVNISKALKLNGLPFKGRNLRISRCESRDKQDKKKMFKKDDKTGKLVKQKVRRPHKMNEDKFMAGRANNNPIVKKIKETQKAKFNKFSEAKQMSKKELFRPGGKMDHNHREEKRESSKKKSKFFGAKVDGMDKVKNKKTKVSKSIQQQKVFAKKLKTAATRVRE